MRNVIGKIGDIMTGKQDESRKCDLGLKVVLEEEEEGSHRDRAIDWLNIRLLNKDFFDLHGG